MSITVLYVILVFATCALVWVGVAIFMRVRRLSRASETQFRRAVREEEPAAGPPKSEVAQSRQ